MAERLEVCIVTLFIIIHRNKYCRYVLKGAGCSTIILYTFENSIMFERNRQCPDYRDHHK